MTDPSTDVEAGGWNRMVSARGGIRSTTAHVTGLALLFISLGMLLSAVVEYVDGTNGAALLIAAAATAVSGAALWWSTRPGALDHATIFTAVGTTWLVASAFGALPYLFAGTFAVAGRPWAVVLADALFESISGYSCTGSTVFGGHNPIGSQGSGVLLYRQLTQWAGGMGIVVLVVTVLPSLRASGLGLIDAEAPGMGVDRLAPRVKDTATRFWKLYTGLTALIAVGLLAAGMGPFDAIAHALTTASTGGFSTRDASIGHWDSLGVELVLVVAMVLGAANFTLHWRSLASRRIVHFRDHEFRGYLTILGVGTLLVAGMLAIDGMGVGRALRMAVFNVVTLGTSSGFGNATGAGSGGDFVRWAAGPQMILLFLMVFGGCAGSTAGGVKVVRLRVGMSHAYRTLRGFRRPRALFPVRQGARTVPEAIVERIAGFMVVYGMLVVVGTVAVTALGTDLVTAVGGVIGALGNMGPALGDVGPADSFVDGFSTPARMVLAVLMLVGRLEIFPMLLMLVAPYRSLRGAGRRNRP
ncbi:MAG: TrkH family potassium uptake protein [Acidimicrobiales bacterium]|nr:TrkH family potassium uptake protein [Acidimicrobiales bacterium]